MLEYPSAIMNRRRQRISSSWQRGLVLAAALCLPTGPAWAGTDNGNGNEGINNGNQNGKDNQTGGNPTAAPEIDPSVAASALAILTGGILVVSDRVRKGQRNREG